MRLRMQSAEFRLARALRTVVYSANTTLLDVVGVRNMIKLALFCGLTAALVLVLNMNFFLSVAAVFAVYIATGGWKLMRVAALTFPRDMRGLFMLLKITFGVRSNIRAKRTTSKIFEATAKKYPNKPCFLFQDKVWTFSEFQQYTNRVANFLHASGYRNGDVIAIFSENCPEMVGLWLGMSKIGVVGALINFNLRDTSLLHCIKISNAKGLIYAANLESAIKDIRGGIPSGILHYCLGQATGDLTVACIDRELERSPSYSPPFTDLNCSDKLILVYTSGTTGLPKAAVISHTRFYYMSMGVRMAYKIQTSDTLYIPLPLYHTAGGILGIGQMVGGGTTLALRSKFSASGFWSDCVKYNCTVAQYIGEICRYLLAQPVRPEEKSHSVRVMFGNGIKPQIWRTFQERFGIQLIGEFYGATEGNCNIVNFENQVGAVGFTTRIAPFLYPITLIKVDPSTNDIIRDSRGICVMAKPGEPGELVGKIVKGNPMREFDGYVDEKATNKKVICDVFKRGDMAFSTGDILVMDDLGYMYFRDRTGDTYRWRGENVSTNEVEAVISNAVQFSDAVVYGVEVPGAEGRAGMAAIVDKDNEINLDKLSHSLSTSLPAYARPVFLRFIKEVDTTGTFKLKKNKLRDEGFDVSVIQDRIYFLSPKSRQYEVLSPEVHASIMNGKERL